MVKIDTNSALKAAFIVAVAAIVLGIFSAIPSVRPVLWVCTCSAGFLLPISAGLLYGFFSHSVEEMGESTLGGMLAGGIAGVIYGVLQAGALMILSLASGDEIIATLAASTLTSLFSLFGFTISGLVFGAIGGIIWPFLPQRKAHKM